ncbi:MAG: cobalt-precorrin-5B (C(1))-methyltransferase CbiD [Mediterranea sp.]|jgi:cobalt-precorrin-5B (C1)-methyltransferase|nr:cobalt-precorrin-5B (C(1))-methyltransferase CbiD [Mediterranea sp.]
MLLIFGGTTEGRKAVEVIDQAGKPFYYSTKGELQEVNSLHGLRLNGAMDAAAMADFCKRENIRLMVDAAHPFAEQLHQTIATVAAQLQIPVIRYDRIYPQRDANITWCKDYPDAIDKLRGHRITRLLALTGVQTIGKLKPFWQQHPRTTWFRIMNREESLAIAAGQGFPEDKLLFYQTENNDVELIGTLRPDAIILKESGQSGGFTGKVTAAQAHNIPVFAIERPAMPSTFHPVNGKHGLRRTIEQLLPGFYPLRTGITTGTCAAAAAVAAYKTLITGQEQHHAPVTLPNGETITVPVAQTEATPGTVACTVIKDAGDDADVTNQASVIASVSLLPTAPEATGDLPDVIIRAGEGVGTVTLPGLGLEVGAPAINAAPRKMITENLRAIAHAQGHHPQHHIKVRLSVPGGEEIAQRTFNPRLGVIGGISIIGTSGIVQPFSVDAFIASIRKSIEVACASGTPRIVINSGAKSEKHLRNHYPDLPDTAFVHYGNHIGETLRIASQLDIAHVTMGIMIGKAVKLAEGHLDTHSKKTTMNKTLLTAIARQAGCSDQTIDAIAGITLARELWTILPAEEQSPFFTLLTQRCHAHCAPLLPHGTLTILLVNENGEIVR